MSITLTSDYDTQEEKKKFETTLNIKSIST